MQILTCFFSYFYFQKTRAFIEEDQSVKVVIVEECLYGIDTDDIGSLEDLPRLVFIDVNARIS